MKKPFWFLAVFLYSPGFAADEIKPLPQIDVSSPADRADVEGLNNTLSALSEKVTACVNAGGKPEACRCSYPKELNAMRTAYATTIKKHPAWKDQIVSYQYVNAEGRNIGGTLVLSNFRRQLEMLKCGTSQ